MLLVNFLREGARIAGLSGVNENLLKKYGVRLVAYDRPGIGQSDPHLKRDLNTSAEDMADIADALGMGSKFWVFAHGEGAVYAWAALHYIPTRLAGTLSILSGINAAILSEESSCPFLSLWLGTWRVSFFKLLYISGLDFVTICRSGDVWAFYEPLCQEYHQGGEQSDVGKFGSHEVQVAICSSLAFICSGEIQGYHQEGQQIHEEREKARQCKSG